MKRICCSCDKEWECTGSCISKNRLKNNNWCWCFSCLMKRYNSPDEMIDFRSCRFDNKLDFSGLIDNCYPESLSEIVASFL